MSTLSSPCRAWFRPIALSALSALSALPVLPASPGTTRPSLLRSDFFYPLPQTTETTTLREVTLGLTCWFSFAFTETFAAAEKAWVSFHASDSIWVYFNNKLLTAHQG